MENTPQAIRRKKWDNLVETQKKSGLSQKEFCTQHGIVISQFVYYLGLSRKKSGASTETAPSFSPVKITNKDNHEISTDIRISLPNGFQCTLPNHVDAVRIKQIMEALLSC
jgi:hypothetical protein